MAETPIFIAENYWAMAATATSHPPDSGYYHASLGDNLHSTIYQRAIAAVVDFRIYPAANMTIDAVVMDLDCEHATDTLEVYHNLGAAYTLKGSKTGFSKGANFIPCTSFVTASGENIMIRINSTIAIKRVRHLWAGIQLPVKAPVAPFDPEKVMQPKNQFFARSGVLAKQSPIYTKKLLEMEINNISATDYINLLALYNKSFLKGLPFWYFLKPTSQPTMGHLYEWDQDEFDLSYLKDGTHRRCSIRAIADYSPDRTTATL